MALPFVAIVSLGATSPLLLLADPESSLWRLWPFPSTTLLGQSPLCRARLPQGLLWLSTNIHTHAHTFPSSAKSSVPISHSLFCTYKVRSDSQVGS